MTTDAFDIQYDGPELYVSNLYSYIPNIVYTINADVSKYLIDVSDIYLLDVRKSVISNLHHYTTAYDRTSLFDALYQGDGIYKLTRVAHETLLLHKITGDKFNSYMIASTSQWKYTPKSIFTKEGNLLTNRTLYNEDSTIDLLFEAMPLSSEIYFYACTYENLYSNNLSSKITVDEVVRGSTNYILPDFISELSSFYIAKDRTLYISSYPKDGNFKWYLPKIATEVFDENINNIHPVSASEMAVFLKNSVYYIQRQADSNGDGYDEHFYIKSKLQVGCKNYSDVITSFDGRYVIFPSVRGLVAMTYQELTASTEQVLTFLSDSINTKFTQFNVGTVKLYKYEYWILCYREGSKDLLCFDVRNNSWWPLTIPFAVDKVITYEDKPLFLCDKKLFVPDYSDDEYYDYDGYFMLQIEWLFKSQKLHLEAPNYYKHISNITLTSVLDEAGREPLDLNLTVTNYRKRANTSDVENFMFNVDTIRVYVKRLNYSKVNEFQYTLQSDEDNAIKIPLSLSSICVKYKISGQVR